MRCASSIRPAPARGLLPSGAGLVVALSVLIAGCASGPLRTADRDGPPANPPAELARVPDAEPKLEPIRSGGPNKPYEVFGRSYLPITQDTPVTERGLASWYGRKFHGRPTASGEVYDMYAMTAAHPTLPIPSYARIRNPANGREVVVRINDRGPFHPGRIVDLSYTAALRLDLLRGVAPVDLERITLEQIRSGAWRRGADATAPTVARSAPVIDAPIDRAVVAVPGRLIAPVVVARATGVEATLPPGATGAAVARLPAPAGDAGRATTDPVPAPVPGATPAARATPVPAELPAEVPAGLQPERSAEPPLAARTTAPPDVGGDAPAGQAALAVPARGFWVQLGAFRARDGAETFHQRVAAEAGWLAPLLAVVGDAALFRLQAGPYPSREEARGVADRVRDGLRLVPVIVERR